MSNPQSLWLGIRPEPIEQVPDTLTSYEVRASGFYPPRQTFELPEAEQAYLLSRCYTRRMGVSQATEQAYAPTPQYKIDFALPLRPTVGLLPVYKRLLAERGQRLTHGNHLWSRLPEPKELLSHLPDVGLLDFIRRLPVGVIRVEPQIKPFSLIDQIVTAWPQLMLLVIARTADDAACLHAEVDRRINHAYLVTREAPENDTNILIGDAASIHPRQAALAHVHMVLLTDATLLTRESLYEDLRDYCGARIYGMVGMNERQKPFAADRIASLCGVHEYRLWNHGQLDQPIRVRTVMNRAGCDLPRNPPIEDVKRRVIWHNHERNRLVAHEAREEKKRLARIRRAGDLPPGDSSLLGVVVENPLHARQLGKLLPEFTVIEEPDDLDGQYERAFEQAQRHRKGVAGLIVTQTTVRAEYLALAIRADAGPGLLFSLKQVYEDRSLPFMVTDIVDRQTTALVKFQERRHRAYRQAGCRINGQPQERDPLARYLQQHPPLQGDVR